MATCFVSMLCRMKLSPYCSCEFQYEIHAFSFDFHFLSMCLFFQKSELNCRGYLLSSLYISWLDGMVFVTKPVLSWLSFSSQLLVCNFWQKHDGKHEKEFMEQKWVTSLFGSAPYSGYDLWEFSSFHFVFCLPHSLSKLLRKSCITQRSANSF